MPYDFTRSASREVADNIKWNRYAGRDVLAMWVADMDFASPPEVTAALAARVASGSFGYSEPTREMVGAVLGAARRDYGWQIAPEWLVPLPGLVTGLNVACRAVGQPGDAVLTATPVYPPFMSAPQYSERTLLKVPLLEPDDALPWRWDLPALDAAAAGARVLLLCHPHNPVGRAWDRAELEAIADIARRRDLVVVSDEIHCDLLLEPGARHLPFAMLSPDAAQRSITLMAASKTYNVAGLGCAFAVVPDAGLRHAFQRAMRGIVPHPNLLGLTATAAAYGQGAAWRAELLEVLRANRDAIVAALDGVAGVRVLPAQATYLAWIDCRGAGLEHPQAFFEAAGVGLSDGADFGAPGFVRLNFGCPSATLAAALTRMRAALDKLPQPG
ncbi:aspartate aminotransferase [Chitiniphilus shinanonensis]|uniref:Putative 8-amino-7-oxononanoate synthase n=1 Tax=Chitiniphilus shinanonensis TaxID=553088 RepID=A0ABQ6BYE9_9NEIS|nr:PatB family C-S lyase [Chitiniphilus shinanonensis]GLS05546.1 aspartate aminotransferase [Chitiniphilus shinanonensis]